MQHRPNITVGKGFTQKATKKVHTVQKEKCTGKKKKINEAETSTKAKRKKGIKTDIIFITAKYMYPPLFCRRGQTKRGHYSTDW